MKQILYILTALFMIASCGPDDPQTETVRLSVDKTSLEFTAEGGDQTFTVTASEQVYIVPGENWLKFKKGATSSDYKAVVTITAEDYRPHTCRGAHSKPCLLRYVTQTLGSRNKK